MLDPEYGEWNLLAYLAVGTAIVGIAFFHVPWYFMIPAVVVSYLLTCALVGIAEGLIEAWQERKHDRED